MNDRPLHPQSAIAETYRGHDIVRKTIGQGTHHESRVVNQKNVGARWLFLDDFISYGDTLMACRRALSVSAQQRHHLEPSSQVGCYLYRDNAYNLYKKPWVKGRASDSYGTPL